MRGEWEEPQGWRAWGWFALFFVVPTAVVWALVAVGGGKVAAVGTLLFVGWVLGRVDAELDDKPDERLAFRVLLALMLLGLLLCWSLGLRLGPEWE